MVKLVSEGDIGIIIQDQIGKKDHIAHFRQCKCRQFRQVFSSHSEFAVHLPKFDPAQFFVTHRPHEQDSVSRMQGSIIAFMLRPVHKRNILVTDSFPKHAPQCFRLHQRALRIHAIKRSQHSALCLVDKINFDYCSQQLNLILMHSLLPQIIIQVSCV